MGSKGAILPRTFSIITASMARVEHLKRSVPALLKQGAADVVVVDYSCPQGTGDYVREKFPDVRVVPVGGQQVFSNWRARNAGAAAATSEVLIFCDADVVLGANAVAWIAEHLPENAFGYFHPAPMPQFNTKKLRLGGNQLKGFQAIPAEAFRRLGGYDEVLEGYAAGGDTDLAARLQLSGLTPFPLDPNIVEDVIEHDNEERLRHHAEPVSASYCDGLIYRSAKLALLKLRRRLELPLETRVNLYRAAQQVARELGPAQRTVAMTVQVDEEPILMPRQLGFDSAKQRTSLRVEVEVGNPLGSVPD
jgi:GT2 family glycosyltransferase